MENKTKILIYALLIGLVFTAGCNYNGEVNVMGNGTKKVDTTTMNADVKAKDIKYKDGVYEIKTEKDYEGFYCKTRVTISNSRITNVEWNIYDNNDRIFDETYEEVYAGQAVYMQQCRDNLKGGKTFGPKLIEVQDVQKVDTISGATWANGIFKKAVDMALQEARI